MWGATAWLPFIKSMNDIHQPTSNKNRNTQPPNSVQLLPTTSNNNQINDTNNLLPNNPKNLQNKNLQNTANEANRGSTNRKTMSPTAVLLSREYEKGMSFLESGSRDEIESLRGPLHQIESMNNSQFSSISMTAAAPSQKASTLLASNGQTSTSSKRNSHRSGSLSQETLSQDEIYQKAQHKCAVHSKALVKDIAPIEILTGSIFFSHPIIKNSIHSGIQFLKKKSHSVDEIRQMILLLEDLYEHHSHILFGEIHESDYDSIYLICDVSKPYDEFVFLLENAMENVSMRERIGDFFTNFKTLKFNNESAAKLSKTIHMAVDSLTNSFATRTSLKSWPKKIISECVEQYLLNQLYPLLFVPKKEDRILAHRILVFNTFVTMEHLDIDPAFYDEKMWSLAQKNLKSINQACSPREKILIIAKTCRILANSMALNFDGAIDADSFLPVFVYNVMKANPSNLLENMLYTQNYRHPEKMKQESGYLLVNFSTAVQFLEHMDSSVLTIDPQEYLKFIENAAEKDDAMRLKRSIEEEKLNLKERYETLSHLLHACCAGDLKMAKMLLEKEPNMVNEAKKTRGNSCTITVGDFPLKVATRFNNLDIVKLLLASRANIDQQDKEGRTVLHLECIGRTSEGTWSCNREAIVVLLQGGASDSIKDHYEKSPRDYARYHGIQYILDTKNTKRQFSESYFHKIF